MQNDRFYKYLTLNVKSVKPCHDHCATNICENEHLSVVDDAS